MKLYLMVAVLATGISIACNQAHKKEVATSDLDLASSPGVLDAVKNEEQKEFENQKPNIPPQKEPAPVPVDWDKQIIRNARISFEVKSAAAVSKAVSEAVRGSGGYIASATEVQLSAEIKHDMTIRVPRERFDELLLQISGYADSLLQKNISSEDVTAEFIDTKSRIAAKEKVKDQYYSFLKQAKNIKEVLEVQAGITELQEQIETATGRINYIKHQSALSTIQLSFFEPLLAPVVPEEKAPGFWKELLAAATDGWNMIQLLIIGLIKIWPLWTGITLLWFFLRRKGWWS